MSEKATFGSWLRDRRKVLDLTQDQLAQSVDCSLTLIRKLEADERRPSKQIAELLAAHLDIRADERPDFVRFARSRNVQFSPTEKSPWRTLRHRMTNLPVPPTPLFGREKDIATVVQQIVRNRVRLLTLVGPPGIGKTRLAIACADQLLDHFDNGVYFISLAPLREPDLVAATIARMLSVKEIAGQSSLESLRQHLADKRIVLVLDNFEQVVAAAPVVAQLLIECPWLQILVTSRVSLHIRAERQFRVEPLALPALTEKDSAQMLKSAAVQLFADRAQSVEPNFSLSRENGSTIAQICVRLEGLPLAVELAATRVDELSLHEMLAQIEHRLALLTEGPGDLPTRHRTLRGAIDWSYDLLDATQRQLFARLAVFVEGWTTETARAICSPDLTEADLTRALSTLADANLVVKEKQSDSESRWSMLETIREYGNERLTIAEQTDETAKRHADFFLAFAESAAPYLSGPHQVEWLNRLNHDHYNLNAAMQWAIVHGEAGLALRLGVALHLYWYKQTWLIEGGSWLKRALVLPTASTVAPPVRQNAFRCASQLAWAHADFAEAEHLAEESHTLAREIGDRRAMASALHVLANVATDTSDFARASALHEQNLALWRELGDRSGIASSLNNLGRIAYYRGEAAQAIQYHEESLALQRDLGDHFGIAAALNNLGGALADNLRELDRAATLLQESLALSREPGENYFLIPFTLAHLGRVALYMGDLERARTVLEEALSIAREWQSRTGIAFALLYLAQVALSRNDLGQAMSRLQEGLELQRKFADKGAGARYLTTIATLLCSQSQSIRAATLVGAIAGLCNRAGIRPPPAHQKQHDITVSLIRARLDEPTFHTAFDRGYAMTMAQAFDFAFSREEITGT